MSALWLATRRSLVALKSHTISEWNPGPGGGAKAAAGQSGDEAAHSKELLRFEVFILLDLPLLARAPGRYCVAFVFADSGR